MRTIKSIFNIKDTVANKISYWLLAGFLITLPFDSFYSEAFLAAFTLHTCINWQARYFKSIFTKEVLVLTAVFLLSVITSFYSQDRKESINIITKQSAVFIIPVAFVLSGIDLNRYKIPLCSIFVVTCTATVIYLYFDALHTIFYFHLPVSVLFSPAFMNHNFSMPIELHATYLSLYVAFSIAILAFLTATEKRTVLKCLYIVGIFILSAGLLQLSSRSVIIALLVIINVVFPVFLLKKKQRSFFCITSVFLSFLLLFGVTRIDAFENRYVSELKKDLSDKISVVEIEESRVTRWEAITGLVKKAPLIGYGTGSEKKVLQDKYFEQKLYSSYLNQLNTHNEYLDFLLKAGFAGLAVFVWVLSMGFLTAWKQKDFLLAAFLVLLVVVCISENILDRNKGIFFYSFFFSLFLLTVKKSESQSVNDAGNYI